MKDWYTIILNLWLLEKPSKLLQELTDQIFEALTLILQSDNLIFKDYLFTIKDLMKLVIYKQKSELPDFLQNQIYEADLQLSLEKKRVPFFEIYEKLMFEFSNSIKDLRRTKKNNFEEIQRLEERIRHQDVQYKQLFDDFSKVNGSASTNFDENIKQMIEQNAEMIQSSNIYRFRIEEVEEDLRKIENKFAKKKAAYEDIKAQFIQLQKDNFTLKTNFDKLQYESDIKEQHYSQSFENYNNSLFLLKTSQEKIISMKDQIYRLEEENRKLTIRGSVTFTELTPRHTRIKDLFLEHKIKEPNVQKINREKVKLHTYVSTVQYIDKLFQDIVTKKSKIKELKKQVQDLKNQENRLNIINNQMISFSSMGQGSSRDIRKNSVRKQRYQKIQSQNSNVVNVTESSASNDQEIKIQIPLEQHKLALNLTPNINLEDQSRKHHSYIDLFESIKQDNKQNQKEIKLEGRDVKNEISQV
eukprot:403336269